MPPRTIAGAAPVSTRSRDIDVLRAVAALLVLIFHIVSHFRLFPNVVLGSAVSTLGQAGVVLFFSISGYLIARPFLRALHEGTPLPEIRGYAARRLLRIAPAYWVTIAAAVAIAVWFGTMPTPRTIVTHVLFIHNLVPAEAVKLYWPAWTLGIEAMFYAVVPIAAWAIRRRVQTAVPLHILRRWIRWTFALSALWSVVAGLLLTAPAQTWYYPARFSLPAMLCLFCPGALVAIAAMEDEGSRRPNPGVLVVAIAVLSVVIASALYFTASSLPLAVLYPVLAVGAGFVLSRAVRGGLGRGWYLTAFAKIGLVSYGIYLVHGLVTEVLGRIGVPWMPSNRLVASLYVGAVVLAITLPLAYASWRFIERPAMQWAARYARRWAPPREAVRPSGPPPSALPISPTEP